MSIDDDKLPSTPFSLKRWSKRKLAHARATEAPVAPAAPAINDTLEAGLGSNGHPDPAASAVAPSPASMSASDSALPAMETLTFDSDFRAFLQPGVAEAVKRKALNKLLHDPSFNVMDGLDVYIDDYSIPSPLSPELIKEMVHARYTLDPPKTRINMAGYVEDVPPDEAIEPAQELPSSAESCLVPTQELSSPIESPLAPAQELSSSIEPPFFSVQERTLPVDPHVAEEHGPTMIATSHTPLQDTE